MEYVVETLEIEIARLKKAIRVFYSTSQSYEDTQEGYPADIRGMQNHLKELEKGIGIIRDWQKENEFHPDWD